MSEHRIRGDECDEIAEMLEVIAHQQLQPIKAATLKLARQLYARARAHRDQA